MSEKIYSQYNMIVGSNTDWAELNPILDDGQPAKEYELKNGAQTNIKFKIGDGVTPWRTLPYVVGTSADIENRVEEIEANTKYSGYYIVFASSNGTILSEDNPQTIITPKVYKQDTEIPYGTFSFLWEKDNVSFSTSRIITVKNTDITDTSLFLLKIYDTDKKIVATSTIYVSIQKSVINLNGILTPNRASTQTYSDADGFEPDFTSSPFKLTATVVDGQNDVSALCSYIWQYRLYGDTNYTTSPTVVKEFTLNQNLMSREKPSIDILCDVSYKAHKISFTEKVSLFVKDNFSFAATLSNEHVIVRTDVNGQNPYPSSMDKAKTTVYAYKGTTLLAAVSSKTALTKGTFYCESDINLSKLSADTFKLTQAAIAVDLEENSSIIKVYIESETNIFDRIFSWSKQRDAVAGEKGDQGEDGNTGATGQGVESIVPLYYLASGKTTADRPNPPTNWVTTPPTWSSGKYVWTCSKVTYKNPTLVVYTTPACDSSWEAVNEVEVGGKNLIINSNQNPQPAELVIEGKSWQANANPTPENPSPIIVSGGSDVVIEGRNLLPNAATSQTSNGVIFTVNADKSITINGIKTNPQASSFAVLSGNFYQYQNKIINFSLDNDYVYSGGAVGVNIGARFTDGRFVPIVLGGQLQPKSFWCNNDIGCIYIEAIKSDLYNNLEVLPQLTLGTTPHPYTPYKTPISLPLPEGFGGVGDVSDRIYSSGGKVWWEKKTKEVVFDGSADENWAYQTTTTADNKRLANRDLMKKIQQSANSVVANIVSNFYVKRSAAQCYTKIAGISIDASGAITVYDELYNTPTSLDGYKTFLSTNNLIVRYQLAVPELTDITSTPAGQAFVSLNLQQGYNRIYSDCSITEVQPSLQLSRNYKLSEKLTNGKTYASQIWGEGIFELWQGDTKTADYTDSKVTFNNGIEADSISIKSFSTDIISDYNKIKLEIGNKFTDWTPAPEDAPTFFDVMYYLSTSTTSLSGGTWSLTAPEWTDEKYMWSKTVTKDAMGNIFSESAPTCIAGAMAKALSVKGGNVFAYNKTGGVTPSSITLTAEFQNASGTIVWQYKNVSGTFVSTGITGTSYTVLPSSEWFIGDQLTLKAYLTPTVYDIVTITKIRDGLSPILLNLELPQGNVIKESDVEVDSLTIKPSVTQAESVLSGYTFTFSKRSIGDTVYTAFPSGSVVNNILTVKKTDVVATLYIKCAATKGTDVLEAFTTVFDLSDPYQCILSSDIGNILKTSKDTAILKATVFQSKTVIASSLFTFNWFINSTLQPSTLNSFAVSDSSFAGDTGIISCNVLKDGSIVASAEYSVSKVYLEDLETKITEKYTTEISKLDGSIGVVVSSVTEVSNSVLAAKQDISAVSKNLDIYQETNDNNVESLKNQVNVLPTKEDVNTVVTSKIASIDILPEGVLLEMLSRTKTVVNDNEQIQNMGQRFLYTAEGFSISDAGVKGWHQNFHNGDEQIRFSVDNGATFLVSSQITSGATAPLLLKFKKDTGKSFVDPEPEQRYVQAQVTFNNTAKTSFIYTFVPSVKILNDVNKRTINVSVDGGATYSADVLNFTELPAAVANIKFSPDRATWHDSFAAGDKYYALFLTTSRATESASLVKPLDYNLSAFKLRFKGPSGIYHYSMQSTDTVFSASVDNGQTFGADTALPAGVTSTIQFSFETVNSVINVKFSVDGVNYFGPFVTASKDTVLYELSGSTENSLFSLILANTGVDIRRKDGRTDDNGKEISSVVGTFNKDGLDTPRINTKGIAVDGDVSLSKLYVGGTVYFKRSGNDIGIYVLGQNSNGHFGLKYMQ